MTFSEGQTADLGAPDHAGPGLSSAEPIFSDLIDRWLREGDRLNEVAGPPGPSVPGDSPTQLDGWKSRARELAGAALGRYRLPTLVAIGLVPLALFLLVAGHTAPQPANPPAVASRVAQPTLPRPARTVLAEPAMTVLAPRPVATVGVADLRAKPATTVQPKPLAVQSKPAAVPPKLAAVPAKPAVVVKRAPVHPSPRMVARTSPPARTAPMPAAKPVAPLTPARPALAATPKVQPAPRPPAGTKIAAKTTFVPDARIAPNLKLGGQTRRP